MDQFCFAIAYGPIRIRILNTGLKIHWKHRTELWFIFFTILLRLICKAYTYALSAARCLWTSCSRRWWATPPSPSSTPTCSTPPPSLTSSTRHGRSWPRRWPLSSSAAMLGMSPLFLNLVFLLRKQSVRLLRSSAAMLGKSPLFGNLVFLLREQSVRLFSSSAAMLGKSPLFGNLLFLPLKI